MNLYDLSQKFISEMDGAFDPETGEIDETKLKEFEFTEACFKDKSINVAAYINNLISEDKAIETAINRMCDRRDKLNNKIDWLINYLKSNMERCNITEVKCPYFVIALRKNPYSTEIMDEALIPKEFMIEKEIKRIDIKPDKTAIKEHVLKTGEQVPGAFVSQKNKLIIT